MSSMSLPSLPADIATVVSRAIAEDLRDGDLTSELIGRTTCEMFHRALGVETTTGTGFSAAGVPLSSCSSRSLAVVSTFSSAPPR